MTRQQIEHIIRAAGSITDEKVIFENSAGKGAAMGCRYD
jgi:hypothetical protein